MRASAITIVLILGGLGFAGCVSETGVLTTADFAESTGIVFHNGAVWTADDQKPWATGVAVYGNRIMAVGDDLDALLAAAGPRPMVIDLEGRMLVPGLHDTHNHFAEVAIGYTGDGNPYEPWPPGWDPVEGTINQQVTAAGHVGTWANRNYDRVQRGGLPAPPHEDHAAVEGREHANDIRFGAWEEPNDADAALDILRLGLATAAENGLTSTVEAGISREGVDMIEGLERSGELGLRFNYYVFPEDLEYVLDTGRTTGSGTDNVTLLGLKIYSDGWLGPRTAALREIFNDRPHRGFAFFTQDEVDEIVVRAHQGGLKVTAHAIGDRAVDMLLTAYERAQAEGCPDGAGHRVCDDPRYTIEHASLVQPDLMDRMVSLGLVPSVQLSFATSDAAWIESALGPDRVDHVYPWATMTQRGLVVGGSSDFPIEVLPPLWGVERAVTRVDLNGEPAGGFAPEQSLDLDTALRTITINAAYLEFRDDELGSITPGKLADLVVLEKNLFEIPADQIADTKVHLTMLDGRPVHAAGGLEAIFN